MGFASTWLEERALFPEIIQEPTDKQTGIIVVVPSYNEPGICKLETVNPASPILDFAPRPVAASSRISPPIPVAAPGTGAMAVG